MTNFTNLGLDAAILKALSAEGYETPTPIQAQTVPLALAGRDVLGIAQTGTGKTAAFALPILQRLSADKRPTPRRSARALILSPTRELAGQIADAFRVYGRHLGFRVATAFGGVSMGPQTKTLLQGVDILVATPGRLQDQIKQRNFALDAVEIFVLDEADRMLDMGFIQPIRQIARALPAARQNLFFSATMPSDIAKLAGELLRNPSKVEVAPVAATADRIDQRVMLVDIGQKPALLAQLLRDEAKERTLIFTRTKHGADRVVRQLGQAGLEAAAIHGNKSQSQRERALSAFRSGRTRILVATDIAARGIDVDGVGHVVNYDLPNVAESYVHRIGRTARAGASGVAISFCIGEERSYLRDIERLIRRAIPSTDRRGDKTIPLPPKSPQPHSGQPKAAKSAPGGAKGQLPPMDARERELTQVAFLGQRQHQEPRQHPGERQGSRRRRFGGGQRQRQAAGR